MRRTIIEGYGSAGFDTAVLEEAIGAVEKELLVVKANIDRLLDIPDRQAERSSDTPSL